jgi:hypothetical protein
VTVIPVSPPGTPEGRFLPVSYGPTLEDLIAADAEQSDAPAPPISPVKTLRSRLFGNGR